MLCALAARSEASANLLTVYAARHLQRLEEVAQQGAEQAGDADAIKLVAKCATSTRAEGLLPEHL